MHKSSKFQGVTFDKSRGKWRAWVWSKGKSIDCGRFNNEIEAAKARDKKVFEVFGHAGDFNFPLSSNDGDATVKLPGQCEKTFEETQAMLSLIDKASQQNSKIPSQQGFDMKLSKNAQKVYNVVPIKHSWSLSQIANEMARNGNSMITESIRIALDELISLGKVRRDGGMYRRTSTATIEQKEIMQEKPQPAPLTPLDYVFSMVSEIEHAHAAIGRQLEGLRNKSLDLYEEMDRLRKEAETADVRARERIMKKFLEP